MHKPEPPKSEVQKRAEDAQAEHEREMSHLREEIGKASFDYEYLHAPMSKSDRWYEESMMAKGLNMHLLAHSAVLAPREEPHRSLPSANWTTRQLRRSTSSSFSARRSCRV